MSTSSDGNVHHERAVVTQWSGAGAIGSARTVETGREVFIAWFTMPLEAANMLSVGWEISLDCEWAESGQDGFDWRGVVRR